MKITIRQMSGPELIKVDAWPCGVPGLVVNHEKNSAALVVTHVRSGCGVAWFPHADPEAVLAAAQALGELLPAWTLSAWDVADEITQGEVQDIVERWGGETRRVAGHPERWSDVAEVAS